MKVLNFLIFQAGWLVCVMGAARGLPWLGFVFVVPALALHLHWANRPRTETRLLLVCALSGLIFDSLLLASGWVDFPNGWWLPGAAPYWMACLWLLFATTLNLSMSWLHGRPFAAAILGAIGGPLAYLAGERLGAISLIQPAPALIALSVGWGIGMPLLSFAARRMNGFSEWRLPDYVHSDIRSTGSTPHV
jgi:hypothetical protein